MVDDTLTPLHPDHIKVSRIAYGLAALIPLGGAIATEASRVFPPGLIVIPVILMIAFTVIRIPVRRYSHWGYSQGEDRLRITRGHILLSDTVVPFGRIQHIDVEQGPIQRRYGLATLSLHTAGNHNSTVSLPGLLHGDALAMRETIQRHIAQETR
jgi:membrane protein YdbS with pleckstrin-like domain